MPFTKLKHLLLATTLTTLLGCIGPGLNTRIEPKATGTFPMVQGIDLTGRPMTLPADLGPGLSLVTLAYKQIQQREVDTWIDHKAELETLIGPFQFYELPVIYEANPLFRWWVNNGMRSGIKDEGRRRSVITIYTDRPALREILGLKTEEIATFLLDKEGRIMAKQVGLYAPEKAEQIARDLRAKSP